MRHGGRIPYLYHFSKGRTHGTAVQRSYGRKEYEKGHHTRRGKGCRGFRSPRCPVCSTTMAMWAKPPAAAWKKPWKRCIIRPALLRVSFQKPFAHDRRDRAAIFAPFFSRMYYIADRVMERYGYRLLLCNSDENLKREKELIDDLLSYKIAALFIVPVDETRAPIKHISTIFVIPVCRGVRRPRDRGPSV